MRTLALLLLIVASNGYSQAIEWITVGDPANDPYPPGLSESADCCTVFYNFEISKHEITNQQYIAMLNAVAASDPNELYTTFMASNSSGGITRSGTDGSFTYALKPGFDNFPVVYVSFLDAIRFANWLHNGMPGGVQDNSTTEDGAYSITADAISNNTIVRNVDAEYFVPTWDEWRKAGYYDGDANTWYDYPIGSSTVPVGSVPASDTGNNANCGIGQLYDVGSYPLSSSPYGTLDQAGNVFEWTETPAADGREFVGGDTFNGCAGSDIGSAIKAVLSSQASNRGFRLARPGEPIVNVPFPFWALLGLGSVLIILGFNRARRQVV